MVTSDPSFSSAKVTETLLNGRWRQVIRRPAYTLPAALTDPSVADPYAGSLVVAAPWPRRGKGSQGQTTGRSQRGGHGIGTAPFTVAYSGSKGSRAAACQQRRQEFAAC